jgi:hypothetical protein
MHYQINLGWLVDQFLIPHGEIINTNKPDRELSPAERLARGRIPPLDSRPLDADARLTLWRAYPHCRERLYRCPDEFYESVFQRLSAMDEATLERHWPRAKG